MTIKHIYWFSNYNLDSPSGRYRGKYPLEELARKGISYSFVYPGYKPGNILHFVKTYFSALFFRKKDSLIVFQKIHTNRIYATALKILLTFRKKNTLYDLDDAEYLKFPPENIHYFMRNCERCSLGSKDLLEYARKHNTDVFLLTSPVIKHNSIKKQRNPVFTIGWIGYFNAHKESLYRLFFPALRTVDFPAKLVLLGVSNPLNRLEIQTYFSPNKNVSVEMPENIDWMDELSVYERICDFDIGISPLLETKINRAKSAFKLKQYFSCGVPVLGSNTGENAAFLEHGINGFFCNTPEEYALMIRNIQLSLPEDYAMLSTNALNTVVKFSMEHYCNTLLNRGQNSEADLHLNSLPVFHKDHSMLHV